MNSLSQMQMLEKYNCEKCRFSTKDVSKYKIHIALHNEMKYVCAHCNFESYTKTEFQRHLVKHTGKFPYTCEYCGYGAIRNDYIVKHIKRIHGDGKIQCSVSTVENESKNASVNIVQAQMRNSLQEILPNNTTLIAKNFIDLTSEVDASIINGSHLNGNSNTRADQVEVEVISPTDQQLRPWMPLTVIAPTSFKVPENCFAQVVEVKPVNGTCYLVLKCSEVIHSNGTSNVFLKDKKHEQNTTEPMATSENSTGSSLLLSDTESVLPAKKNTPSLSENNPNSLTSQLNEKEMIKSLNEVPNEIVDETVEDSAGPIISSVFSLSSGSLNVIEGIQWESPTVVTNTNAPKDPTVSIGTESQGGPKVPGNEEKYQVINGRLCEQKTVLNNEPPETKLKSMGSEIQLLFNRPVLTYGKKTECQTSAFAQSNKREGRKSTRLCQITTNLFSKPQTLFLSCDKRIVMQPLSCVMQTGHKAAAGRENELVALKLKRHSAKSKDKILTKRFASPTLKTLRLYPAKPDQLTQVPHKHQPVVVLNHPELESLEVSSIMKAISMFKGEVLTVTLSRHTRRKLMFGGALG